MSKICSKCGVEKPVSEFIKRAGGSKDGLRASCKTCGKELQDKHNAKFRASHREEAREYSAKYRVTYRDRHLASVKRWCANNVEKCRAIEKERRKRRNSNPKYRVSQSICHGISKSLKRGVKAGRRWETLVGYTVDQLKTHIEKHFEPWMNWGNYGEWEIDHVIPLAVHNYKTPEDLDFKRAWALKNLRPLEAKVNSSKGAKIYRPFQPSLMI